MCVYIYVCVLCVHVCVYIHTYICEWVHMYMSTLYVILNLSGLYLQDLTFINMVGDKLEDDKSCINFNKRWKQFNTVDKIRLAQTK